MRVPPLEVHEEHHLRHQQLFFLVLRQYSLPNVSEMWKLQPQNIKTHKIHYSFLLDLEVGTLFVVWWALMFVTMTYKLLVLLQLQNSFPLVLPWELLSPIRLWPNLEQKSITISSKLKWHSLDYVNQSIQLSLIQQISHWWIILLYLAVNEGIQLKQNQNKTLAYLQLMKGIWSKCWMDFDDKMALWPNELDWIDAFEVGVDKVNAATRVAWWRENWSDRCRVMR